MDVDFLAKVGGEGGVHPSEGDQVPAPNGTMLTWKRYESPEDYVMLQHVMDCGEHTIVYAYSQLESPAAGECEFRFGSEDGAAVWVNGSKVKETSDHGPFTFDDLTFRVALHPGLNGCLIKLSQLANQPQFSFRATGVGSAVIDGRVIDAAGNGVGQANVVLFRDGSPVTQIQSDASGSYRVRLFSDEGAYDLSVTSGELGAWKTGIHLKPAGSVNIDVSIAPSVSIAGTVRTLDGQTTQSSVPVQALELSENGGPPKVRATLLSGPHGEYQFVNLHPGTYRVRCQASGGFSYYTRKGADSGSPMEFKVGPGQVHRGVHFDLAEIKKGSWKTYTTSDGLSDDTAISALLGADGFMWFGTRHKGACRFDGSQFESLYESGELSNAEITKLAKAPNGDTWMGSSKGVSVFDGISHRRIENAAIGSLGRISSILVEADGSAWIGTKDGLFQVRGQNVRRFTVSDGLSNNEIYDVLRDRDGIVWIGTMEGVSRFDGQSFTRFNPNRHLSNHGIYKMLQAGDGTLWMASGDGILHFANGEFTRFSTADGLVGNILTDAYQSKDGLLWFASSSGLSRFDGKAFVNFTELDGLGNIYIQALSPGANGDLWCATDSGISHYDPSGLIQFTAKDGFVQPDGKVAGVLALLATPDGDLLIGTGWAGLFHLEGQKPAKLNGLERHLYVRTIHRDDNGILWIGTNEGIFRGSEGKFEKVVDRGWILAMTSDRAGNIWFGHGWAGGGVSRYDTLQKTVTTYTREQKLPSNNIWALERDPNEGVWIGSDAGLLQYDGKGFQQITLGNRIPKDFSTMAVRQEANGDLWVGGSDGLVHKHGEELHWLNRTNGLPPVSIFSIRRLDGPIIWCGTVSHGLLGYDGTAMTLIDSRDGLAGRFVVDVAKDTHGNIWVGSEGAGLTHYHPDPQPPGIRLTKVAVDDDQYADPAQIPPVRYGQRVAISYREIDFKTHPLKRQFIYQLLKDEKVLVRQAVTSEREYHWTPREAGDYVFEVRAIDRDLNYSKPSRLSLHVFLPWYLDSWVMGPAVAGLCGLMLFSIVTAWRYVVQRREATRLRECMLEQERLTRGTLEAKNHELIESAQRLNEAKEAAEIANHAKSAFLANMSHEIRTPLNAIMGYAQILHRDSKLDKDERHAISTIERSGNHLLALINEILDLSKIESGRMEAVESDFDLRELLQDLAAMFDLRCRQRGLIWRLEGLEDSRILVRGDEGKLRQVLINLLGNAVKFTDAGSVHLKVAQESGDYWRFEVTDSGPGIPQEAQETIFEPFTQGQEGKKKGGTGLGLAISRRQIEIMGGELKLKSELGKGSQFYFRLRLLPALAPVSERPHGAHRRVRGIKQGTTVAALVVDDNVENREVLSRILESLGLQVCVVDSGLRALTELEARRFDIGFLDIRMPEMSGVELAERIIALYGRDYLKLVAISASVLNHEQKGYFEIGFNGFVPKPFRFEQVCDCLAQLLEVEFDYEAEPAPVVQEQPLAATAQMILPEELLARLIHAAEAYSVTEFENYLKEVEALGGEGPKLSARLLELSQNVQIDKILEVLKSVAVKKKAEK